MSDLNHLVAEDHPPKIQIDNLGFAGNHPPYGFSHGLHTGSEQHQRSSRTRCAVRETGEGLILSPGNELCKLGIRKLVAWATAVSWWSWVADLGDRCVVWIDYLYVCVSACLQAHTYTVVPMLHTRHGWGYHHGCGHQGPCHRFSTFVDPVEALVRLLTHLPDPPGDGGVEPSMMSGWANERVKKLDEAG